MLPYDLISFQQLLEGPGKGYSPTALAALRKVSATSGGPGKGGNPDLPEPKAPPGGWVSAGAVVIPELTAEGMKRCYIRLPTNSATYGGWTLPKGRVDAGETYEATARREVLEEIGVVCAILPGSYLGNFKGTVTVNHYYVGVQVRKGLSKPDKETEQVRLVTFDEAIGLFTGSNKARDTQVVQKAQAFLEEFKKSKGIS